MLLKFVITAVFAASLVASQDFDYDEESKPRPAPARLRPGYSGSTTGFKQAPAPPVAILKQINRHNEDGSYTYGYESGDGSFKIETKAATGEVKGKYGFLDDKGKLRVVEYGATKHGFAPQGEGITVPPPTLVDETTLKDGRPNPAYQEEQYEPEPLPQAPQRLHHQPQPQQHVFQNFPSNVQFVQVPQNNPSPLPKRPAAFPGAALTTDIEFGPQAHQPARNYAPQTPVFRPAPQPQQTFSFEPAPIQEEDNYADLPPFRPAPRPAPPRPAPAPLQFAPQPQYTKSVPRPAPPAPQSQRSGGILDQLEKDYALPSGGSPALHDISFGYY